MKTIFQILLLLCVGLGSLAVPLTHNRRSDTIQPDDPRTSDQLLQGHLRARSPYPWISAPTDPTGSRVLGRRGYSMLGGKHKAKNAQFGQIAEHHAHHPDEKVQVKSRFGGKKVTEHTDEATGKKYRFHYTTGLGGKRLAKVEHLDENGNTEATVHHKSSFFTGKHKSSKVVLHNELDESGHATVHHATSVNHAHEILEQSRQRNQGGGGGHEQMEEYPED